METIIRHVRDIDAADRQVLEHVIGRELSEDQKVIFQVVPFGGQPAENAERQDTSASGQLPDWCNVFDGLTEEQLGAVEGDIRQRADLTRPPK